MNVQIARIESNIRVWLCVHIIIVIRYREGWSSGDLEREEAVGKVFLEVGVRGRDQSQLEVSEVTERVGLHHLQLGIPLLLSSQPQMQQKPAQCVYTGTFKGNVAVRLVN